MREAFLSSNKAEIVQAMWEGVKDRVPEEILRVMAEESLHELSQETSVTELIRLSWCLGYYDCLRSVEAGALVALSKGGAPEKN